MFATIVAFAGMAIVAYLAIRSAVNEARTAGRATQQADAQQSARDAENQMTDAATTHKTTGEVIDDMRKGKF